MFYVGIIAHVYPARRRWLLAHIESYIAARAGGGLIHLSIRPSAWGNAAAREIVFRAGNRADYQTAWECLCPDIYPVPAGVDVRHLIDGGANIGLFSVWHSSLPNLQEVLLIEPDPKNLDILRRNTCGEVRFSILPAALSDSDGEAFFVDAEANTGHLAKPPDHSAIQKGFYVSCKRIRDIIGSEWDMQHTWLKLDIEGAEFGVLEDMFACAIKPAAISLEVHDFDKAGGRQLVENLRDLGYQVDMLHPGSDHNTCRQLTAVLGDGKNPSRTEENR